MLNRITTYNGTRINGDVFGFVLNYNDGLEQKFFFNAVYLRGDAKRMERNFTGTPWNNLFGTKCYKWFIKTKSSRDGYRYIEESKFLELSAKAFSADAGQTHFKLLFNFIMYTFRYTPKIEFVDV